MEVTLNARFTHTMPDELHERIKALAVEYGTDVKSLINMTMRGLADFQGDFTALEQRVSELEKEVFKNAKGGKP